MSYVVPFGLAMSIAKVLPQTPIASTEHADIVLEIAYLMTAVDGRLGDDELEAYRQVATAVRGKEATTADVDALLQRFADRVEPGEIAERIREIAPKLPDELKDTTFRLAVALSLVDLDSARDEEELQDVIIEALGLDAERTDKIVETVYAAFDVGS